MNNLNLIIRGFVYRENWTPLSSRKQRNTNYTINFIKCIDGYKQLINKLQTKYNVKLFISTYDTSPEWILNQIKEEFNTVEIFLTPEKNSSQFSTTCTALKKIQNNYHTLIIRSDILITDKLINIILNTTINDKDLYVLCKEKNKKDKVIDIVHVFANTIKFSFLSYISKQNLKDAHKIHKEIRTSVLDKDNMCVNTENCKEFYTIYSGDSSPKEIHDE